MGLAKETTLIRRGGSGAAKTERACGRGGIGDFCERGMEWGATEAVKAVEVAAGEAVVVSRPFLAFLIFPFK